ncbi:hypothetical protein B23_2477 [Geobacillus thermoleovorans B23]|nr:hypothetical protein B23_2477 [Geobacillus thermoleovorans B23]
MSPWNVSGVDGLYDALAAWSRLFCCYEMISFVFHQSS